LNTNFSGADFSLLLPELPTGIYVISVMGAGSVYQQSVYVY
jgi:predicted Zn-dependent protease